MSFVTVVSRNRRVEWRSEFVLRDCREIRVIEL